MYVTLMFQTKGTRLTKPTVCLMLMSMGVLVGVVRVAEYRNHWSDVLAGYLTGGAIAAFLVRGPDRRRDKREHGDVKVPECKAALLSVCVHAVYYPFNTAHRSG